MSEDQLNIQRQIADLNNVAKRMKLWHEALDAASAFLIKNKSDASEVSGSEPALMKFHKNTWMPMSEAHFVEAINEDGSYQIKTYANSVKHAKRRKVAIDVGANIGLWARPMTRDFDVVHCFEPQSLARACFSRNVTRNNAILYPFALGRETGETTINVNRLALGGGMIIILDETQSALREKYPSLEEPAHVVRLDDFNIAPDYIKIDVQGFEAEVLRGAVNTLKIHKPTIVCESGGSVDKLTGIDPAEALNVIENLGVGYKIVERIGKDVVMVVD